MAAFSSRSPAIFIRPAIVSTSIATRQVSSEAVVPRGRSYLSSSRVWPMRGFRVGSTDSSFSLVSLPLPPLLPFHSLDFSLESNISQTCSSHPHNHWPSQWHSLGLLERKLSPSPRLSLWQVIVTLVCLLVCLSLSFIILSSSPSTRKSLTRPRRTFS